jgi:hypothetical protein
LEKLTWMSLPWEVQQKHLSMDQLRIHGIKDMYLVAHQVVAVQQLQQKNAHMHWVQIQVDQLDSQVHFVV